MLPPLWYFDDAGRGITELFRKGSQLVHQRPATLFIAMYIIEIRGMRFVPSNRHSDAGVRLAIRRHGSHPMPQGVKRAVSKAGSRSNSGERFLYGIVRERLLRVFDRPEHEWYAGDAWNAVEQFQ